MPQPPEPTQTKHKQQYIVYGSQAAYVDAYLANLLLTCWMLDIHTVHSCQEIHPGQAWIKFRSETDAVKFFQLAVFAIPSMSWRNYPNKEKDPNGKAQVYFDHWQIEPLTRYLEDHIKSRMM